MYIKEKNGIIKRNLKVKKIEIKKLKFKLLTEWCSTDDNQNDGVQSLLRFKNKRLRIITKVSYSFHTPTTSLRGTCLEIFLTTNLHVN